MLTTLVVMTLLVGIYTGVTSLGIGLFWYVTRPMKNPGPELLTQAEEDARVAHAQEVLGGALLN